MLGISRCDIHNHVKNLKEQIVIIRCGDNEIFNQSYQSICSVSGKDGVNVLFFPARKVSKNINSLLLNLFVRVVQ